MGAIALQKDFSESEVGKQLSSLRETLADNGYKPVAVFSHDHVAGKGCKSAGKQPFGRDWLEKARKGVTPRLTPHAANTGIVCDGLQVVDIDVDDESAVSVIRAEARHHLGGNPPVRVRSNSPRVQLFYRADCGAPSKRKEAGKLGAVEILGKGQQTVVYGVHPSGVSFDWLDGRGLECVDMATLPAASQDSISGFLDAIKPHIKQAPKTPYQQNGTSFYKPENSLSELEELLSCIPPDCDYETWLRVLMAAHKKYAGSNSALHICDAWSATGRKYKNGEVAQKWNSFKGGGINGATLAAIAREYGADLSQIAKCHNPSKALQFEAQPRGAQNIVPISNNQQRGNLAYLGADRPYKPSVEIVRDTIPARGVGFLAGQSGAFKTFCAIDLSFALMTGEPFAGRNVERQGGVIYVAAEGAGTIEGRVKARRSLLPNQDVELPFFLLSNFGAIREVEDYQALHSQLCDAQTKIDQKHGLPISAVIIDTVSAAGMIGDGEENDPAPWTHLFNGCGWLSKQIDAPIVLIHHYGKSAEAGLRGSSNARAGADFALAMTCTRDEITGDTRNHMLALTKSREAVEGAIAAVNASPVEIGKRKCGDPVTSLVLNYDAPQKVVKKRKDSSTVISFKNSYYAALETSGRDINALGKADAPIVRAAKYEDVKREFFTRYVPDSGDENQKRDAQSKAFRRALDTVQARGDFCSGNVDGEGWLWSLK